MIKKWTYTLSFRTPSSIYSGHAIAGLVDRKIVRTKHGLPYIPGSTVKGRWRFYASRLLSAGLSHGTLSYHKENEGICKNRKNACTICRLFGSAAIPAAIWIGQADLQESIKKDWSKLLQQNKNPALYPDVELRPGISLSRLRRSSLEDHLFFDEAVPAAVSFTGKIIIQSALKQEEKDFLIASARLVDRIGARKAAGRGILVDALQIKETAS